MLLATMLALQDLLNITINEHLGQTSIFPPVSIFSKVIFKRVKNTLKRSPENINTHKISMLWPI